MAEDCPCGRHDANGRSLPYALCCGRYVDDYQHTPAPDAEALMRSRYSAFVRAQADYLRATWHASMRPSKVNVDDDVKWLGLEVRDHRLLDDSHAEVAFVARQRDRTGRAVRLHERSRFVRETDGGLQRWYYVDGEWK